jgi:hypothetical protein
MTLLAQFSGRKSVTDPWGAMISKVGVRCIAVPGIPVADVVEL